MNTDKTVVYTTKLSNRRMLMFNKKKFVVIALRINMLKSVKKLPQPVLNAELRDEQSKSNRKERSTHL